MKLIVEMDYDEGRVKLSLPKYIEKVIQGRSDTILTINNTTGLTSGTCEISTDFISSYGTNEIKKIYSNTTIEIAALPEGFISGGRLRAPINPDIELKVMRVASLKEQETIKDIVIGTVSPVQPLYDYTVEQGEIYEYYLVDSDYNRISANFSIVADFEDIFLTDCEIVGGERTIRQLRVKYNPKISSFKTVVQETKTDTIGGKYPFFFRNGQIGYKEIPISGLLETGIDEQGAFAAALGDESQRRGETAARQSVEKTNIIARERRFKLAVEEWLRNGKAKLFRSGPEGSYIIRLMNVSLSPNDTLGRRLHTFSSTGYEIQDPSILAYNHMNLYEDMAESQGEQVTPDKTFGFVAGNQLSPIVLKADNDNIISFTKVSYGADYDTDIAVLDPLNKQIYIITKGNSKEFIIPETDELRVAIYQGRGSITCTYNTLA